MNNVIVKGFFIITLAAAVTSCKVAVILVEGGEVQSTVSGSCQITPTSPPTGTVCIHEVIDTTYSESFTAFPDTGWHFVRWNSGDGFLCEDSTDPTCVVSNVLVAGIPAAEAVVASSTAFYIMPIFVEAGMPITDIVVADGKEWAQVDLFTGLTWSHINAVCPAGVCANGGVLNGYDMTGWTWASGSTLASLVNHYAPGQCTTQCDDVFVFGTDVVALLMADGFRTTCGGGDLTVISGVVKLPEPNALGFIGYSAATSVSLLSVGINAVGAEVCSDPGGAWFYRTL